MSSATENHAHSNYPRPATGYPAGRADIWKVIRPLEQNLFSRLAYSLQVQTEVMQKIQREICAGCSLDEIDEVILLRHLHRVHGDLMSAHKQLSKLSHQLYAVAHEDCDVPVPLSELPF